MDEFDEIQDIITLFIDGEADELQKSKLFSSLSSDAALQEDFQNAIKIKNAATAEFLKFEVPENLTKTLFYAEIPTIKVSYVKKSFFNNKIIQFILIGFTSASAAIIGTLILINSKSINENNMRTNLQISEQKQIPYIVSKKMHSHSERSEESAWLFHSERREESAWLCHSESREEFAWLCHSEHSEESSLLRHSERSEESIFGFWTGFFTSFRMTTL